MRLDLEKQKQIIRWEHKESPKPLWYEGGHTMYRSFSSIEEETRRVAWLKEACRPLDFDSLWQSFAEERSLIQNAPHDIQNYIIDPYVPRTSVPLRRA
jgi:hypothetical protein